MEKMNNNNCLYLVGIDEVGRGPLVGPVCVGLVAIEKRKAQKILKKFSALDDSKKMSVKNREFIFEYVKKQNQEEIFFEIQKMSAKQIDKIGISNCIKKCIEKGLKNFEKRGIVPGNSEVRLDGALRAPSTWTNQKTIIKGDSSEKIISLASVISKVYRDNLMINLHKKFPQYGFDKHKGYGTQAHIKSIKKYGFSTEHRKYFCKNI